MVGGCRRLTYSHRPAFTTGHHTDESWIKNASITLMNDHTKYVLHLNGHSHNYERTCPIINTSGTCAGTGQRGIVYLTVGTGGASLEQDSGPCESIWRACAAPWTAFRAMRQGPIKLTFNATAIQGEFICGPTGGGTNDLTAAMCPSGSVGDSFTVTNLAGPDTTAPAVSMTAPANGATVFGTAVTVSATATDDVGVVGVQFKLDGSNIGTEDTTSPYSISWNSTTTSDGSHALTAVARDAAANSTTSAAVNVTVTNNDTTAPTGVGNVSPANGATSVALAPTLTAATASDTSTPVSYQFELFNGSTCGGAAVQSRAYSTGTTWTTAALTAATTYSWHNRARDSATIPNESTFSACWSFTTTAPDAIAPTVSITAPTNGATVSGTITVSASASDNVGVVGVQFKLDGANLGTEDTTSPYSISWNSTTTTNGSHSLTATARDAAGNSTTSSPATAVTVSNVSTNLFFDDFEDGVPDNWTTVLGTWSIITDGTLVYSQSATTGDAWSYVSATGSSSWTNYSVESRVKLVSSSAFAGVYGRWVDNTHWYYATLRSNNTIELKKNNGGTITQLTTLSPKSYTITPNTWYTVKLVMNGPNIELYIDNVLQLSATDTTFASGTVAMGSYLTSANFDDVAVSSVGGESDITPPVISSVLATGVLDHNATISYSTSELGDTNIEYDVSTAPGFGFSVFDGALVNGSRSMTINGLGALTAYKFRVSSKDAAGNRAAYVNGANFTTTDTLPAISGITVSNITSDSATVSWTTNINATSQIEYGSSTSYGFTTTCSTTGLTSHSQTMSGLSPSVTYHFRVLARRTPAGSC